MIYGNNKILFIGLLKPDKLWGVVITYNKMGGLVRLKQHDPVEFDFRKKCTFHPQRLG